LNGYAKSLGVPPSADFQIAYDGPALGAGEMDVRDLAPALLAIGDLCHEANAILNGDGATVTVNVKAVHRGSFELYLILDQIKNTVALLDPKTAKELAEIIFGSQGGIISLIALIKIMRGKPIPSRPAQILQDGSTIIDLTNANLSNSTVNVTPTVRRLYESESARKSVERIVKPLEQPGIDTFQIRTADIVIEEVNADEVEIFKAPSSLLEKSNESEREWVATYEVVTASFEDRYQWRLGDAAKELIRLPL
jgi:hypothetical protein